MAEANVRLRVDANQAVSSLRKVNNLVGQLGVALGAADLARRFFKGFAEADKAAAAVRTLGVDTKELKSRLGEVSNELKGLVSQTELTTAAYDVASAGFTDAASAANILKAATQGAVGGLSDLGTVADATTSVLNAYGLSSDKASKLVDGFIQTQNDGKIIVAQYAAQIGRVAPIAAAAGVGIEELNAAISAVTATGVPVESTFAGLRQAIASVIKPTEEARKTSKLLGLQFDSAAIKTKGFGGFLEDVIEKTGGSEVALTKLFGSVEAVATILPLANDKLEKFNTSLDNQKDSAGAAERATEDLGGTVTAQVTSIVNNIGNVARALDTRLGPSLKRILGNINDIISAASTAISKFTDLATGGVSRAAAALQAAASTGFANEGAFTALKKSIGTLRPELAQSEADLLKLEGALDEARSAAFRFTGKGDFGRLRNEVEDTITAMRQLIINRREALGQKTADSGTSDPVEDPQVAALQERIRQLLAQLNAPSKSATGKTDEERQAEALERSLASSARRTQDLKDQASLAGALTEEERRSLQLNIDLRQILEDTKGLSDEVVHAEIAARIAVEEATDARQAGLEVQDKLKKAAEASAEAQRKAAEKMDNLYASIGQSIQSGIVDSLTAAVDGTKKLADVAADTLRNVANILLQFGVNTALGGLGSTGGILGKIFGGFRASGGSVSAGRSYMVGEKGPELFTPGRSGSIAPSGSFGGANVTVNVDASGTQAQGNQPNAKLLGQAIGAAVQAELIKQKRPGGLLSV
jgi:TP901 family phage tail tape measure protein